MRPIRSDLLEADRLKAGGIRPGTWALKNSSVRTDNEVELCVANRYGFLCVSAVLQFGLPTLATAQIYSWHDANGHLVLSDHRAPGVDSVRAHAVTTSDTVRTTQGQGEQAESFDPLIADHARQNGVREELVRAVVQVESAFNPNARSRKGALGLMQLMPATIQQFGVANPFNPADNVRAGVRYLRQLLDRYGNNEQLALAAYNAGSAAVDRHGERIPPYSETRQYVSKVSEIAGEAAQTQPAATHIYKVVETIQGREVVRYTDRRP